MILNVVFSCRRGRLPSCMDSEVRPPVFRNIDSDRKNSSGRSACDDWECQAQPVVFLALWSYFGSSVVCLLGKIIFHNPHLALSLGTLLLLGYPPVGAWTNIVRPLLCNNLRGTYDIKYVFNMWICAGRRETVHRVPLVFQGPVFGGLAVLADYIYILGLPAPLVQR